MRLSNLSRQALRERIETALDTGLVAFFDCDIASGTVSGDATLASFYGLDPERLADGLPCEAMAAHLHPDDRARFRRLHWPADADADAREEAGQLRVIHPDGRLRWLLVSGHGYRPGDGGPLRYTGIVIDVSAVHMAETALRTSEAEMRMLLDSTAEGFYAVDRDGVTTLCNRAFLAMHGFAGEHEAVGRRLHDVIHHTRPDGARYDVGDCPIYLCARDGMPAHVVGELFFRLDGSSFPVEYWAYPILRDGELAGAICSFFDITERIAAQQALEEESRTLEILNRMGRELASELDLERVVQRVTDVGVELSTARFGAFFYNVDAGTHGEVHQLYTLSGAPRSAFSIFPMPRATDLLAPTFQGGRTVRSDDVALDPRYGRNLPYAGMPPGHLPVRSYLAVPVVSRSGEALGGLVFGHPEPGRFTVRHERLLEGIAAQAAIAIDNARLYAAAQREIAERRRAEAQLLELNETLEARIAEALAERGRIEAALRQSQKMEAVGQLTGGIAHDFNNLLAGISGSLELLQTRIGQGRLGDTPRYIEAAQGAARRAAALTHRLLAFSRRQTLDPHAIDPDQLVAGMEELIRRTMGPQIAVEVKRAAEAWTILADPSQLENALLNLCINARDAMPDGGRLVIETAHRRLDRQAGLQRDLPVGEYVSLCVSDDGTGMPPDVVARAFDPFFTTKPIGQGTGLGLSMTYGFARQSGGQVRIHSVEGAGSTVCLFLPRHGGQAEPPDAPARPEGPARAGRGETVLVIDDEATVRMLVTEVLKDLGYVAVEAADGAEGLAVLRSGARLDLLITDVGLPGGMNGRQVADAGRALRPGLRVLFITGYAETAVLSHGHLEPGMHVLTKPFAMEALGRRIRELIEAPSGPDAT